MVKEMICVVIVGGDQARSKSLFKDLQDSGLFHVVIQPRIHESHLAETNDALIRSAKAYGRPLSISERCCSLAHRSAQEKIERTGGIVLEDDAVVLDIRALADFASQVIKKDKSVLINFSTLKCAEDVNWDLKNNSIIQTFAPSALAVGYAGSRAAIRQLIKANSSLEYVADWPPIKAKHLRLRYPIVAHGHRNSTRLISDTTQRHHLPIIDLVVDRQFIATLGRLKSKALFELSRVILWLRGAEK